MSRLPHAKRIAVWDVDRVVPELRDTLARLNAAQKRFGFETVDLSVPLDALEKVPQNGDAITYLRADRIADRLGGKTIDLHANYLVCVTHLPLSDEKRRDIYVWWSEDRKSPLLVLSYAGFEQLQTGGILAQRALVNVLAEAIAGAEGRMQAHDRGPQECPMFSNSERKLDVITSPKTFDEECRKQLDADDLEALETLLKLFDGTATRGRAKVTSAAKVAGKKARGRRKAAKK